MILCGSFDAYDDTKNAASQSATTGHKGANGIFFQLTFFFSEAEKNLIHISVLINAYHKPILKINQHGQLL